MRLKDYIITVPEDEVLYIGAESGYFFIGTRHQFWCDINEINDRFVTLYNKRLHEHETDISKLETLINQLYKLDLSDEDVLVQIDYAETKLKRYKGLYSNLNHYMEHYVPLQERLVKEIYSRRLCESGTVVIVHGIELGGFWFKHEYDERNNKKDGHVEC